MRSRAARSERGTGRRKVAVWSSRPGPAGGARREPGCIRDGGGREVAEARKSGEFPKPRMRKGRMNNFRLRPVFVKLSLRAGLTTQAIQLS